MPYILQYVYDQFHFIKFDENATFSDVGKFDLGKSVSLSLYANIYNILYKIQLIIHTVNKYINASSF